MFAASWNTDWVKEYEWLITKCIKWLVGDADAGITGIDIGY